MRVLVIDTALTACTVGVVEDGRVLAARSEVMAKGHQERLAGFVREVVEATPGGFAAVDRIGVTIGPGSFTGLRVGLAFAQGLGAALDRPVAGVSTLAALAASGGGDPNGVVAAAIDARRGQVYLQTFRDGAALTEPEAANLDEIRVRLAAGDPWRLTGSGAPVIDGSEDRPDLIVNPTVEALAALTVAADPAAAPPRPLYLRAPDATPPSRLPGQPRPPRA